MTNLVTFSDIFQFKKINSMGNRALNNDGNPGTDYRR